MKRFFGIEIVVLVVFLTVIDVVAFLDIVKACKLSQNLSESHVIIMTTRDIHKSITQAESGQRGFILTGKDYYLDPYYTATTDLEDMLKLLEKSRIGTSPKVQHLRREAKMKLGELAETINLYRTGGAEPAIEVVKTDRGQKVMVEMVKTVASIRAEEESVGAELEESLVKTLQTLSILRGGHALLAVVLCGLLIITYRRQPA